MTSATSFFVRQLERERETWKVDHDAAMRCRDLESLLRKGVMFFYAIRTADESWSEQVQDGKVKYSAQHVRDIRSAYEWWLKPCEAVNAMIQRMEQHFKVEEAEAFRTCWRLARNLVSIDIDRLIESTEQAIRGEVAELTEEDWGGLQSSTDTSGAEKHTATA